MERRNNFDLIRLLAAIQVVLWHGHEHLELNYHPIFFDLLQAFPGVPIFFTVSGFLIYASYDRKPDVRRYFESRAKRIFPALWVCFLFTIGTLVVFNQWTMDGGRTWIWILSQVTFFQLFTPAVFKDFGAGSPNGSLWTIPVEVSFYIFIPVFFFLFRKNSKVLGMLIFAAISLAYNWYASRYRDVNPDFFKLLTKNLLPFLFYFLLGSLAYLYWPRIKKFYDGKAMYWFAAYMAYYVIASMWLDLYVPSYYPNFWALIGTVILTQTTLSIAFSGKALSEKTLHGNDISYGTYLYHMPVVNILIELGYRQNNWLIVVVLFFTLLLAYLSWRLIEKPILATKSKPKSLEPAPARSRMQNLRAMWGRPPQKQSTDTLKD
jgi:peptidoglycan/LPS O-acetylase OafA/YrhL